MHDKQLVSRGTDSVSVNIAAGGRIAAGVLDVVSGTQDGSIRQRCTEGDIL